MLRVGTQVRDALRRGSYQAGRRASRRPFPRGAWERGYAQSKETASFMNGLIRFSLSNWYAVIVLVLTVSVVGSLAIVSIPVDILPVNKSPAVQVLTFYGGMP